MKDLTPYYSLLLITRSRSRWRRILIEVLILGWQVPQYRRATGAHISAQNRALPSSARLAALSGDSCQVAPGTSSDSAQETIGSSPW